MKTMWALIKEKFQYFDFCASSGLPLVQQGIFPARLRFGRHKPAHDHCRHKQHTTNNNFHARSLNCSTRRETFTARALESHPCHFVSKRHAHHSFLCCSDKDRCALDAISPCQEWLRSGYWPPYRARLIWL